MPLGERIKELRKERSWSQGDLAEKVGSDARQISRYENGKITPSTDAVVKIAEVFDVSLDYLLIDTAPRRPLHAGDPGLAARLGEIGELPDDDRESLLHIVDALLAKNRVKAALASGE